jgi:hypothetical protein
MTRICSFRQLLFYFIGIFCLLTISLTGAFLHYGLQVKNPLPIFGRMRPLRNNLPTAPDLVTPGEPGTPHNPKPHHPPLIASGSNYGLSHTECRTVFPTLFEELDRSVELRKVLGNVSLADIDLSWKPYGAVRVMIYNHQVISIPLLLVLWMIHGS